MADTRITDAEIAGYMGWRGPGAYTEASLRKIRQIIDHVLRVERATPPSPITAPEVDERAVFEAKYRGMLDLTPCAENDSYMAYSTYCAWRAWKDRGAALASRPAEVDDEGLPPLPTPWPNSFPYSYTAEQYRQGQRDAVAADRARRAAAGGDQ
jgi:hypothetical protein